MASVQYRLKPEAFIVARKRLLLGTIPMFIIMVLAFVVPHYFAGETANPIDEQQLLIVIGLMAVFTPVSLFRIFKKKRHLYDNFVLTVDDNSISCTPLLREAIDFTWLEVTRIVKNADGSILIHGGANNAIITVPAQVENKEQLIKRLNEISPVLEVQKTFLTTYGKYLIIITTVIFLVFLNTNDKVIIGITGPVLMGAVLWSIIALRNNRQMAPGTQRKLWWILIPFIGVAAKTILVLTNYIK